MRRTYGYLEDEQGNRSSRRGALLVAIGVMLFLTFVSVLWPDRLVEIVFERWAAVVLVLVGAVGVPQAVRNFSRRPRREDLP